VVLLRMVAVKNSQKRSEAFGSARNNAGGLAGDGRQIAWSFEGNNLKRFWGFIVNDNVLYHSHKEPHQEAGKKNETGTNGQ
jgi:hypothetical protein